MKHCPFMALGRDKDAALAHLSLWTLCQALRTGGPPCLSATTTLPPQRSLAGLFPAPSPVDFHSCCPLLRTLLYLVPCSGLLTLQISAQRSLL